MSAKQPDNIIIIKKGGHGKHGHHGGAWKVAYADFVTAMMAFFLVMWIVGQSAEVKAGVGGYFRDPTAFSEGGGGNGVLPGAVAGVTSGGEPTELVELNDVEAAEAALEHAAEAIREALERSPQFVDLKDRVEITLTEEGLRIELREAPNEGFFDSGSAEMKRDTVALLAIIAGELKNLSNRIAVEGHTDNVPYAGGDGTYTNWELSADRANAARRVLEIGGLRAGQIEAVRGYADQRLRFPETPSDAGNRRISIVVRRG